MEFNELLEQCKSKKLKTTLEKIYKESKEDGVDFNIYDDMLDTLFDVEIEEDFDENVMAYFEPSEVNKEIENDGWFDYQLHEDFAKLLRSWKWNNGFYRYRKWRFGRLKTRTLSEVMRQSSRNCRKTWAGSVRKSDGERSRNHFQKGMFSPSGTTTRISFWGTRQTKL